MRSQAGHTLTEILLASLLISLVFLIMTSLYVSSLKFLNGETTSPDMNSLLALETMTRDASVASDVSWDPSDTSQFKLRIDTNDPATARTDDDKWVSYRFINGALRTHTVNPPNAVAADVTAGDAEVAPGLSALAGANQSGFQLLNPTSQGTATVLQIQLVVAGAANAQSRTFLTSVAVKRAK